jgi:DMSO/TMAO reductase YedYZ molybdopterin-dependent catalytic subunit
LFLLKRKNKERQRLPPNQRWVEHILKWGEEHPGIQRTLPEINAKDWRLTVNGLVGNPVELTWEVFLELEQVISVSDFHCVETWSVKDQKWEGVRFSTIQELVKFEKRVRYALFESYDGYTTSLPINELQGDDVLLANRLNDEPLPQSLGGPMRLVIPHKYGYKSPMWLRRITLSRRDKLGYWEKRAYSNSGDPWRNDRYTLR